MGKIAKIIRRTVKCNIAKRIDEIIYDNGVLTAERAIIKLIEELIIEPKKIVSRTGDSVINYYNEIRQNLTKLKEG